MQYTYRDVFPLLKPVFELVNFDIFSASVFCFTSSTWAKGFHLRTFFMQGEKSGLGQDQGIGRVEHRGHAVFGQKLLSIQCSVGRCAHILPIMRWANALGLQKIFTKAERSLSQQRQLVNWHRWVPRMLPYGGKPVLQRTHQLKDNSISLGEGPSSFNLLTRSHLY